MEGRRAAADLVGELLTRVADGRLSRLPVTLRFWDGSVLEGTGPEAAVVTVQRRAVAHLLHNPTQLGLARAWVDGSLQVEGDLEAVLRHRHHFDHVGLSHRDRALAALTAVRAAGRGVLRPPPVPAIERRVRGRLHSKRRDAEAVRHHYDVSNDFYALVLGPSMVYSCAYFSDLDDSLEHAQERKLDLICRKLMLEPRQRLLDIGSGWGSLAFHAAANYGAKVLGITLSPPQAAFATARAAELGLSDRVRFEIRDYRELAGATFDRVASVGMFEHVGGARLTEYFARIQRLLVPGGLLLNHGIGRLTSHRPQTGEFISRYIFPDGELLPLADTVAALQAAGLEPRDVESLRDHYPPTLRAWVANLRARGGEAVALVGRQRTRTWELYMAASALAFEQGEITVYQVLAARGDGPHGLPLDRTELLTRQPEAAAATAWQRDKLYLCRQRVTTPADRTAADRMPGRRRLRD